MLRVLFAFLFVLMFLVCLSPHQGSATGTPPSAGSSGYTLESSVVSSGGAACEGVSGWGNGTLAQPTPIGVGVYGDMILTGGFWPLSRGVFSGLGPQDAVNREDRLFQNLPNPFGVSTTLEFSVSRECHLDVSVFDVQGRRVRTLVADTRPAGRFAVAWDGLDDCGQKVSPGIYFCRLQAGEHTSIKKMVLSR